jgi:zinc-ribbon domain
MFCPTCGSENADSNRFCVSCGSTLSQGSSGKQNAPASSENWLRRLVGTTRTARIVTAVTAIAIVGAIVGFIALSPNSSEGEDAYLRTLDRNCVAEKERITALEQETLQEGTPNLAIFSSVLVTIVAEWRANLESTPPPPVHAAAVEAVDVALREVLIEAGSLARVNREEPGSAALAAQAGAVDKAAQEVDDAIEELNLSDCSDLSVGLSAAQGS